MFSTEAAALDWLRAAPRDENITEKRTRNATTSESISRPLVAIGLIDPS